MINNKNMFTYKIRKVGIHKDMENIVPVDPSNIFEFTSKKRKMINFDEFISGHKSKINNKKNEHNKNNIGLNIKNTGLNIKNNGLNIIKRNSTNSELDIIKISKPKSKLDKSTRSTKSLKTEKSSKLDKLTKLTKSLNFTKSPKLDKSIKVDKLIKLDNNKYELNLKPKKINKLDFTNTKLDKIKTIRQNSSKQNTNKLCIDNLDESIPINDNKPVKDKPFLALKDCQNVNDLILYFTLRDDSEYSKKLANILKENKTLFVDTYEEEIKKIETEIERVDTQRDKWCRMKEKVLKENVYNIPTYNKEEEKEEQKEEEEYEEMNKIKFIKDNMKTYLCNLTERINEAEKKIFNLTANDREMDPLILLNALTKYN
ncbi:uncharacterized protein VNE69_05170 [Vairimorpha necatrix]|uniref:Uncharacterized protein n=1 Tax=Vairimorpha necatrix TaxID=6039 RepID=A0AAX4JCA7_9MICR